MKDKNGREHEPPGSSIGGQFTSNDGDKLLEAVRKYEFNLPNIIEKTVPSIKPKDKNAVPKDEFFGERFDGYVGADAIEKLLQEKRGYVRGAFYRKEVGDIDLVWGNENAGLNHLIQRRDKAYKSGEGKISGLDMARKIPEIIEKGTFYDDNDDKIHIDFEEYRVAICPKYYNEKVNWIITAYDLK